MKRILLTCFLIASSVCAFAQEDDSVFSGNEHYVTIDTADISDEETESVITYSSQADSLKVEKKLFDKEQLNRHKSDPDLDYKIPPTVAESLWDRFWLWIADMIDGMFDKALNTNWGRIIVYVIGLALLVVLIMLVLKVNAFRVFYSGEGSAQKYQVLDENIHEMDFDKLIQEAMDQQDYRRGIRLLFLYALKLLSDKNLIQWELGKTNHDYIRELGRQELKSGFNELSYYFDYAWYGNFTVSRDTFIKVQNTFTNWKNRLS